MKTNPSLHLAFTKPTIFMFIEFKGYKNLILTSSQNIKKIKHSW